jgi:hypothetical protein
MNKFLEKKLLICIAFHYVDSRIIYLEKILEEFKKYEIDHDIIIDTNSEETLNLQFLQNKNIEIVINKNLEHPYHLTCRHRFTMLEKLDSYDWFMYLEDDMLLPYENFESFTEKFEELWPSYTPSFIRVENHDSYETSPDIMIPISNSMVVEVKGKKYVNMPYHYNYHAFWILPKYALKKCIENITKEAFLKIPIQPEVREYAASFVIWQLKIPSLLSITEDGKLDTKCMSYHLPNNYQIMAKRLDHIWKINLAT